MDFLTSLDKWAQETIFDEILIFALLISFFETFAQNTLKMGKSKTAMMIGLIGYTFVGYILHYSYSKFPISKLNVIWSSMSIILAIILGYSLYDESINFFKLMSLFFALLAITFSILS
jgi:multidrug transporter EmrE-like cation transporter